MIKRTIEGSLFREMLLTGAACLEKNKQAIDAMNVFRIHWELCAAQGATRVLFFLRYSEAFHVR